MGGFLDKAGEIMQCFWSGSGSLVSTLPGGGLTAALEERAREI
jgi:hypothetical protein